MLDSPSGTSLSAEPRFALQTHSWEAMGTVWHLSVYFPQGFPQKPQEIWSLAEARTAHFEHCYSRFIPSSEVNSWRTDPPTQPTSISPDLQAMLQLAQQLRQQTHGAFDPAVGGLLEETGYDPSYSFQPKNPENWQAPAWQLTPENQLSCSSPLILDIGGFGKGYWIDQLSAWLTDLQLSHHLVDGGGDMFATAKPDGSAWRVAIESATNPAEAVDVISLQNQGLAVSDTFKRRWGEWNHVLDPRTRRSAQKVDSAAVVAPRAAVADGLTTCLMVAEPELWADFAQIWQAEWLITQGGRVIKTQGWTGEFHHPTR